MAALIWVFIKLPQEYWIHIAQLDFTDILAEHAWAWPLHRASLLVVLGGALVRRPPAAAAADWPLRIAADPLPEDMDTAAERAAWRAEHAPVRSGGHPREGRPGRAAVGASSRRSCPGVRSSEVQLFVGTRSSWSSTPRSSCRRPAGRSPPSRWSSPSPSGWR